MAAWTKEKDEILIARYPYEPTKDIAAFMGISVESIATRARKMGLKKTDGYVRPTVVSKDMTRLKSGTLTRSGNVTTHMMGW